MPLSHRHKLSIADISRKMLCYVQTRLILVSFLLFVFYVRLLFLVSPAAQVLLWKASLVDDDGAKQASLLQAEEEAKAAMQVYKQYWGDYSLKLAQAYTTLAQIYARMDK